MLNIGPRANGNVPYEITDRLEKMGEWLEVNGESIYKSEAFDLRTDMHDWGKITSKTENGKTKLYLHVFNWPLDHQIRITGINSTPSTIYLLSDKLKSSIPFEQKEVVTRIQLPFKAPDPYVSVIVMEFDQYPKIEKGLIGESIGGGYALTPKNISYSQGSSKILSPSKFGSIPERLIIEEDSNYEWRVYIDQPETYLLDISYSFQDESDKNSLTVKMGDQELGHEIQMTGKTVGEPKSAWVIDSYNFFKLGEVQINHPGFYDIKLDVNVIKNQTIKFNRLWLEKL